MRPSEERIKRPLESCPVMWAKRVPEGRVFLRTMVTVGEADGGSAMIKGGSAGVDFFRTACRPLRKKDLSLFIVDQFVMFCPAGNNSEISLLILIVAPFYR